MEYVFTTDNVCSKEIKLDIQDNKISNVEFIGGCNGNLKAIAKVVDGWTIEQVEENFKGITCGRRPTSCADQLVNAVKEAYQKAMEQ